MFRFAQGTEVGITDVVSHQTFLQIKIQGTVQKTLNDVEDSGVAHQRSCGLGGSPIVCTPPVRKDMRNQSIVVTVRVQNCRFPIVHLYLAHFSLQSVWATHIDRLR